MKNHPEVIVELANSHSGKEALLKSMLEKINTLPYKNLSVKFQVFSPSGLAMEDYSFYAIYQTLCFNKAIWKRMIKLADTTVGRVWLDVFDIFGIEIYQEERKHICGIKLQASVLENYEIRSALKKIDNTNTLLMLNISGFDIDEVNALLAEFQAYHFKEIILQVGFQAYPTRIEDTGLQKIGVIKNFFTHRICMADHVDAQDSFTLDLPILSLAIGCDLIEKHFCLDRKNTAYDAFSSLEPEEFLILFKKIENYIKASNGNFINDAEHDYLKKTIQIPVSNAILYKNSLICATNLKFRRTTQQGLTYKQIVSLQSNRMILNGDIPVNTAIRENNFKKALIAVIVAGRLKSSRLEKKALRTIGKKPSIQVCLESCLKIKSTDLVILATSIDPQDDELVNHTIDGKVKVFRGDPDDVLARYVAACDLYGIDVVVRVTADCPFISNEIAEILIDSHFKTGADFTAANNCAVGTSCEIINVSAMRRVIDIFGCAEVSEYMSFYFQNNPDYFKLNSVDLPAALIRDYRLTLDYSEDLMLFEKIYERLAKKMPDIDLLSIFKLLDDNPTLAEINRHCTLTYKVDQNLIDRLYEKTKIESIITAR